MDPRSPRMAVVTWCFGFPYCPNEPIREQAWGIVEGFYEQHFPGIPRLVHSATRRGERFLRAATRNQLVTIAQEQGFDIVVLVDADTLIHPDGIRRMIQLATTRDMFLGKPFLKGINLPVEQQQTLADSDLTRWPHARFNDPGAAWVIRPETWWAAGGMDENLTGWGADDSSFGYIFAAIGGHTEYDQHAAVKTDHPTPRWRRDPDWPATLKRELVTKAIWENPHAEQLAHEWLEVRHMPGICDEWVSRLSVDLTRRTPVTI